MLKEELMLPTMIFRRKVKILHHSITKTCMEIVVSSFETYETSHINPIAPYVRSIRLILLIHLLDWTCNITPQQEDDTKSDRDKIAIVTYVTLTVLTFYMEYR